MASTPVMASADLQMPTAWAPGGRWPRAVRWAAILLGLTAVIVAVLNSSRDVSGTRIGRPDGAYVPDRTEFLGISNWYLPFEIGSIVIFLVVWSVSIYRSRRHSKPTPTLILMSVTTALVLLDPIMNWAPYAAYDPRMLHFNVDWPWINLAPTVEPWAVIIGYGYFFLIPAWITLAVYRRWATRASIDSWIVRKSRLAVLALSIPICIVWDGLAESLFVQMGFYTYTQVIPFGSTFTGTPGQFPLIWEAVLFGLVIAPTAPLMWVDDRGQTWGESMALRFNMFRGRPHIGAFTMAFAVMGTIYLAYGLCFGLIRATGIATEVATPWRYPETAVYDPQGYFEEAGNPGPFYRGTTIAGR